MASRDPGAGSTEDDIRAGALSRDGKRALVVVTRPDPDYDTEKDQSRFLLVDPPTGASRQVGTWYTRPHEDWLEERLIWDGASLSGDGSYLALAATAGSNMAGATPGVLTGWVTRLK